MMLVILLCHRLWQFSDLGSKTERYTRTVGQLTDVLDWWASLSEVEQASRAVAGRLVLKAEGVIAEEQLAWTSTPGETSHPPEATEDGEDGEDARQVKGGRSA